MNDPDLLRLFFQLYYSHFSHPDNWEQMFSGDLTQWLLNGMDAKLTGEFNSAVDHAMNPKAKQKIPPKLNLSKGETFFHRSGIMPTRWAQQYDRKPSSTKLKENANMFKAFEAQIISLRKGQDD